MSAKIKKEKPKHPGQPELLNESKLGQLTGATVKQLNREAGKYSKSWIAMGKIVHDFITALRETGCKDDPFQMLAAHPESVHQTSQLRNYEACYNLWQELGGETGAPAVSMTHFILVQSQDLDVAEKKRLLEMAAKKGLSVAQLKKLIVGEPEPVSKSAPKIKAPEQPQPGVVDSVQGGIVPVETVEQVATGQPGPQLDHDTDAHPAPIDWNTGVSTETQRAMDRLSHLAEQKGDESLPAVTREKVVVLVRFILTHFLNQSDIDEIIPDIHVRP